MKTTELTPAEVCERGQRLYDERLRDQLEPQHNGKYVVLDIETGEYEMDADHLAASDRAWTKRPGAPLYGVRVGQRWAGTIGYSPRISK